MSDKCDDCGAGMTAIHRDPDGDDYVGASDHLPGGKICLTRQVAQLREEKELLDAIRATIAVNAQRGYIPSEIIGAATSVTWKVLAVINWGRDAQVENAQLRERVKTHQKWLEEAEADGRVWREYAEKYAPEIKALKKQATTARADALREAAEIVEDAEVVEDARGMERFDDCEKTLSNVADELRRIVTTIGEPESPPEKENTDGG